MSSTSSKLNLLVAVGSRHDRVCSVGAFARAEAKALEGVFNRVEVLEPDANNFYPDHRSVRIPDVVIFHTPSLYDRGKPWRPFTSSIKLRAAFPKALFIAVVHEYSEAPKHWRLRQAVLARFADGVVVNSDPDYKGMISWHSKVLRTHLGPTLFYPDLIRASLGSDGQKKIEKARTKFRSEVAKSFSIGANEKWVLHPGLVTPGKGVNLLGRLAPFIPSEGRLIVMGGLGPKPKDKEFARIALSDLEKQLEGRLTFIEAPSDETYKKVLIAADLVVLPYDVGLSERRSSFLSAMSCGANVWTTFGRFTSSLSIETSGAHFIPAEKWIASESDALKTVELALNESDALTLERRQKNLVWANKMSWDDRAEVFLKFIESLC